MTLDEQNLLTQIQTLIKVTDKMRNEINANTSLTPTEKGDKMRRLSLIITHLETASLYTEKL